LDEKIDRLARFDEQNAFEIVHFDIDRGFKKTQLAMSYLLLYNMVEAVMTQVIYSIHEVISDTRVCFNELNEPLKKLYLSNFKKVFQKESSDDLHRMISRELENTFNLVITSLSQDKIKLFSGNIISDVVKEYSKKYGFSIADHDQSQSRSGRCLQPIKDMRNELAHGSLSFMDCGHSSSVDELKEYAGEVYVYLKAIIEGVELYLSGGQYRMEVST
jgi:hypothetical protein